MITEIQTQSYLRPNAIKRFTVGDNGVTKITFTFDGVNVFFVEYENGKRYRITDDQVNKIVEIPIP